MKKFLLGIIIVLFIGGCSDKRLILVPQNQYYPTFPTADFNVSKKYHFEYWIETEEETGNIKNLMVADEKDLQGFIKDTKTLRSTYNVLLKKLNGFNLKIQEMNKIQNEKKPTEIEDIKDSWFK